MWLADTSANLVGEMVEMPGQIRRVCGSPVIGRKGLQPAQLPSCGSTTVRMPSHRAADQSVTTPGREMIRRSCDKLSNGRSHVDPHHGGDKAVLRVHHRRVHDLCLFASLTQGIYPHVAIARRHGEIDDICISAIMTRLTHYPPNPTMRRLSPKHRTLGSQSAAQSAVSRRTCCQCL